MTLSTSRARTLIADRNRAPAATSRTSHSEQSGSTNHSIDAYPARRSDHRGEEGDQE